ncbi:MAG: efflux RND transporter permease subunit [Alphaproteobacteria bacterium]|nr:efflux RND transporter permease subunit [Alphaproteobacteria bacterium]
MLKFFVRRPITTLMFVLFWVVLGLYSFSNMNIERTPALDFPYVTASFIYPGAEPAEIESQILKKAEDAMSEVAGLKKITSSAYENGGYVMAEFNLGVNVNDKASEVKAKLDALSSQFPDDMKQPIVEKLNPLQQSVIDIAIYGDNVRDLYEYTDETLSNKITGIKGVASVNVFGGLKRAIRIEMSPDEMAARGVTVVDIVAALGNKNLNVPGGKIETGTGSSNVRFMGEFASVAEIENLQIVTSEGQNFKLTDVASVHDSARDIDKGAQYNGRDVIVASVIKASDGNAIKISKALRKMLPDLQAQISDKFPGAKMEIVADSSTKVSEDTFTTINGILLGILFTVLILLAFTQNWRSTVIAGVVIPASLVAGIFFVSISGFTVNAMTLLAYSSALGTLVSNAIILIESALQEMRSGKNPEDAAVDGTKRVAVSVLAGVGTNVVVFLPLAFMGGIVGQFMVQFGMTVVYLTLLSLLFSFTLTPMMIARFLRLTNRRNNSNPMPAKQQETHTRLRKWYDYQFAHAGRVILIGVVLLIGAAQLMKFVGNEFQPSTDANTITLTVRAPMGSTYEKSSQVANNIDKILRAYPEVESTVIKIGERGLQNITITTNLVDRSRRNISDKKLAQAMLKKLSGVADAEIQIRGGEAMSSGVISSDMVLNVYGDDDAVREQYANELIKRINNIPEVQSAVLAQQKPNTEIRFVPDQEQMSAWGIKNSYAGSVLRTAIYGNDSYKYKENGKEYPIVLEFARPFKTNFMFNNVFVNSPRGMVALSELGEIQNAPSTPTISRLDKSRVTEIDINIGKSTVGPVQKKIEAQMAQIQWKPGYKAVFAGMSEIQSDTTTEIGMAFILASVLTFMLLAAILNSLTHPLTIATSIITSFIGVFALLFLSGASMNVGAMLAFVMLVGLVVNNNILVLEPTVKRVRAGEKPYDALWTELMSKRNMVLMTSIAVMAGMLPQLWSADGMKSGMAAVMIGGMFASLVLTFTLTPALFFAMESMRTGLRKKLHLQIKMPKIIKRKK